METEKIEFWAKTTEDGRPGISVRDHCLNVGCVAEHIFDALPPCLRNFCPSGATLLIAAHDIGKISTGFAVKCAAWIADQGLAERAAQWGWNKSESNHAAVSQDYVWTKLPPGRAKLWAVAVGGHHGRFLGVLPTRVGMVKITLFLRSLVVRSPCLISTECWAAKV